MLLALDYDGCFTADPKFWTFFANDAVVHGHQVITVTHRRDTCENAQAMRNLGVSWPIVFAHDKPKKLAAIEAGYHADIFIDDNPVGIGDGSAFLGTQSIFEIELRNAMSVIVSAMKEGEQLPARLYRIVERLETVLVKP